MRRISLSLVIAFALLCNVAYSQLEVIFTGNPTVLPGGQVSMDVSVNNMDNIIGIQFSMNWDSLVLQYNSVNGFAPTSIIPYMDIGTIGTPAAAGVNKGQATFSWYNIDGQGITVPDGTKLFTLVFDGLGEPCESTSIIMTSDPRVIEVIENTSPVETDIGAFSQGHNIEIDCDVDPPDCGPNNGNPNCGGGDPNGVGVIGSDELVEPGDNFCMEITVDNFVDLQSAQFEIIYDASVLTFTGALNFCSDVSGLGAGAVSNINPGVINFVYFDNTGVSPSTLPDGKVLFEACFDAIGPHGTCSDIVFGGDIEYSESNSSIPSFYTDCGSVKICEVMQPDDNLTLYIQDSTVVFTGDEICIPIYADNFEDVSGFQFTIDWQDNLVNNAYIANFNPLLLTTPVINSISTGNMQLNWVPGNGGSVTLPDSALMFVICFDYVGDCSNPNDTIIDLSFINLPNFAIEFGDSNDQPITPIDTDGATIIIDCPDCEISLNASQPDCIGDVGSILITGGATPYQGCEWSLNGDTSYDPGGCNITTAAPGTYCVTVTDANGEDCEECVTLANPDPITFDIDVVDIDCSGNGTLTVTNIMGGSGTGYTVSPSSPLVVTTEGMYSFTVSDSNGCEGTGSATVGTSVTDLVVVGTPVVQNSCSNADGKATVNLSGGCPPFTSTGTGVANGNEVCFTDLTPGDYIETISDGMGNMVDVTFTVDFLDSPTISASITDANENMDNGKIELTILASQPYTWTMSPMAGTITADTICDLPAGDYTFVVTDANGCTVSGEYTIGVIPDEPEEVMFDLVVTSLDANNGFGVSCFGNCDATAEAIPTVVNGSVDSVIWTDSEGMVVSNTLEATGLCAGVYTVTIVDTAMEEGIQEITISSPTQITIDVSINCENEMDMDGAIDIFVSGGVPGYTFDWGNGIVTEDLDSLSAGDYNVQVLDQNGCLMMLDSPIEVCRITDPLCISYEDYVNIITPGNADGVNDVLEICGAGSNPNIISIYDRWGRKVNGFVNYANTWNGVDESGNELGEGTYFWVMEATINNETRIYKGSVTILRDL